MHFALLQHRKALFCMHRAVVVQSIVMFNHIWSLLEPSSRSEGRLCKNKYLLELNEDYALCVKFQEKKRETK